MNKEYLNKKGLTNTCTALIKYKTEPLYLILRNSRKNFSYIDLQ